MAEEQESVRQYRAFLSYSHRDSAAARQLHRQLETYRIPKRLAGNGAGPRPERLGPIFRDREEFPAADDLSRQVRAALAASRSLIVLCSPHSAGSPWVSREIATFRDLHPERPIFAVILAGEPPHCFPADLSLGSGKQPVEPLAADLRKEGDGRRLGFLKLVAGLSGLRLDQLVQRDAQRRIRRVMAITAGAVGGMLLMTLLAIVALAARADAEQQRREAEDLVEFMLTDLRDRLEGVGRLDVLTTVNRRALAHYQSQDLDRLPADALERRARLLHAMGEDDQNRGDLGRALSQFQEAARTTGALLAADPRNPDRIFAHGQSAFWVGSLAYERGNRPAAKAAFEEYKSLSDRLVEMEPANAEWLKEAAYADGNVCTIALDEPRDLPLAIRTCRSGLAKMQAAARSLGTDTLAKDLANRHAWLADAYRAAGRIHEALDQRHRQRGLIEAMLASDPDNRKLQASRLWAVRAIGNLEAEKGRPEQARAQLGYVVAELEKLVRHDPANQDWRDELGKVRNELKSIQEEKAR